MHFNTLDELLSALPGLAQQHADALAGRSACFLLATREGRQVYITLADGRVDVTPQPLRAPDCTVSAAESDLLAMIDGKLKPMKAIMFGKVSIKGDPRALMELISLIN